MNKYLKITIYVLVAAAIIYGVWYFFFKKKPVVVTAGDFQPGDAGAQDMSDFVPGSSASMAM